MSGSIRDRSPTGFFQSCSRQEFVGRQLKQLAESQFGGAMAPLLLSLVKQTTLSKKDRAAIERLIENIRE